MDFFRDSLPNWKGFSACTKGFSCNGENPVLYTKKSLCIPCNPCKHLQCRPAKENNGHNSTYLECSSPLLLHTLESTRTKKKDGFILTKEGSRSLAERRWWTRGRHGTKLTPPHWLPRRGDDIVQALLTYILRCYSWVANKCAAHLFKFGQLFRPTCSY